MKTLHKINVYAVGVNILLIIIPFLAMLLLIPLGIIQIIIALIVTFKYYKRLDVKHRKIINLYWLFVALDFLGIAIMAITGDPTDIFKITALAILPPFIAIYFVYTTYTLTKYLGHGNAAPQNVKGL